MINDHYFTERGPFFGQCCSVLAGPYVKCNSFFQEWLFWCILNVKFQGEFVLWCETPATFPGWHFFQFLGDHGNPTTNLHFPNWNPQRLILGDAMHVCFRFNDFLPPDHCRNLIEFYPNFFLFETPGQIWGLNFPPQTKNSKKNSQGRQYNKLFPLFKMINRYLDVPGR